MEKKLETMALLKAIKKIVYMGGSDNLHAKHNKVTAHINFMGLYQEKFQDKQELSDQ